MEIVWKELRQGKLRPIYICYGTDCFLQEETFKLIERLLCKKGFLDKLVVDLEKTAIQDLLSQLFMSTLLQRHRFVLAKNAIFLTAKQQKKEVKHDYGVLQKYLQNIPEDVTLILTVEADKLDKRKKIVQLFHKSDLVVRFRPLSEEALKKWLYKQMRQHDLQVAANVLEALMIKTSSSMLLLKQEVQKLAQYPKKRPYEVTMEDIDLLVPHTPVEQIFVFVDQLAKSLAKEALQTINQLGKQGIEPLKLLFIWIHRLRLLSFAKEVAQKNGNATTLAKEANIHPFFAKGIFQQAQLFTEGQILCWLKEALAVEEGIKSGHLFKELAVKQIFLNVITSFS